ncbi:DUF2550 domain-containing protein [Streptomonospora nanhaiensis]|uniref:Secreted/membrane protein n=1 Tax=Streptomonospora nanhaiensis TaxID=1323731 RepID=A0A853BLK8_9ACTN|nr:DUF2550 domain-containing protein [Streptomonospora nanhaiensis]MBV2365301.1 DUF2550 domain-containing protein [Streptomonospora nanhaiensis]MBX9390629.1 DUF2550 domain-containing protein [Streptomonospora nanhaiensis]NYI95870.1 hypothetical protein [Streptomonospora nanhaiensis]
MRERILGQAWFLVAEWVFIALLVLTLLGLLAVTGRRFVLERGGGGVECYLRVGAGPRPTPWRMGFGRYGSQELRWYRIFSLWPRPTAHLSRRGLVVMNRRTPTPADLTELTMDLVVVEVGWLAADGSDPKEPVYELAMTEGALTGFLSWLESMPPGTHWES